MKVFILAHCRNPKLFGATRMVFDTIRVGFPTAEISVFGRFGESLIQRMMREKIRGLCRDVDARFFDCGQSHPEFIRATIGNQQDPFFFSDTDISFWSSVEGFVLNGPIAGRLIPKFRDEFSKAVSMPRLHTSLLYVHPEMLLDAILSRWSKHPQCAYCADANFISPMRVPALAGGDLFLDVCAILYAAVGGHAFTEEILNCYDHLFCGTCSDEVAPHLTLGKNMTENNLTLIEHPEKMKGIWREQERYFEHFAVKD